MDSTLVFGTPLFLAQTPDVKPNGPAAPAPTVSGGGSEGSSTLIEGVAIDPDTGKPVEGEGGGSGFGMLPIFILVLVVMWIFLLGGQRKEKKKRAALLAQMTKGDKVQTVGGILGTIVEVRDDRVIVKVDENSNTRVPFARSAIQTILTDGEPEEIKK